MFLKFHAFSNFFPSTFSNFPDFFQIFLQEAIAPAHPTLPPPLPNCATGGKTLNIIVLYIFYISGGRIDHASHGNAVYGVVNETVAMSDAVDVALRMTSESDTLIVVTADHSHTLTMAGYPGIDDDILGSPV